MNSVSCCCFRSRDFVGCSYLQILIVIFSLICCGGCENEKSFTLEVPSFKLESDLSESSDENMYTSADGDFMVDYDVEFLPYLTGELEENILTGTLSISKIVRADRNSSWVVSQYDCQEVKFPIENTLPLFLITDNLQIEDSKEGFMLNFYDGNNQLLRTVSYSVEEWLLIIGKIRQSHYGYLPVDLNPDASDFLIEK